MPKIIPNQSGTGGVIRWDSEDWMKGLVPHYVTSIGTNRILGSGLMFMRGIDIFRKPGFIMPGAKHTDVTNVSIVDAMIKNGAVDGKYAYLVSGGANLHKLDTSTTAGTLGFSSATSGTVTVGRRYTIVTYVASDDFTNIGAASNATGVSFTATGTTPTTWTNASTLVESVPITHGGHSTVVGEDIVKYNIAGTNYIFYSFNDATDGDVGRYDLATTFDDDYMSNVATAGAVLSKLYPHPMIVGDDDILYIANGKNVASFQGSNTTFNSSALDLPNDYMITSFAKTPNYLVIYAYKGSSVSGGAYYRTESTAFFWDYISPSYTYAYPLLGNYVNGGFNYRDTIGCFTQGRSPDIYNNKYSRMLLFNGTGFEPVVDFYDNIPGHGGVDVEGDIIYWNSQGKICQWGSPIIGFEKAFSKTTELLTGVTGEGMLRNFSGNKLFGSSGTTTGGGLQLFTNSGYYFQSSFSTPMVSPPFKEGSKARIKKVKVFWGEATTGGHYFTLTLESDRTGTTTTIINNLTVVASPDFITDYELDTSGNPFPNFESLKLTGSYTSGVSATAVPPYIEAVEVYYEYKNN